MRKHLLGVLLVAASFVAGCGQTQQYGGIPRTKSYHNVISLSPSTSELMSQFQIPLIGRSKADNWPAGLKSVPIVGDLKPDYEAIQRLHPDLILLDRDLYSSTEVEKLKAISEVQEIGSYTVDDYIKEVYELGNKLGNEDVISEYVDKVDRQRQTALGDKFKDPITAALIIPDSTGHEMIAGTKTFQADLIKIMGATPLGPDSKLFEPLNPESLMTMNPDFIIVAGEIKDFTADARFANLKAVKEKKLFGLPQDIILRRGARVDQAIYQGHKALSLLIRGD
ncbi:MAG: ABC transporter substrate-binding protein [Armatimonadetes bacterium]|nr:ABC transporter substrate-binding protein [Armatimonadota bacterium]MBS1728994.1 ABC transporter substrate-binding protein [Armatimonadota bacterium]